MPVVSLLNQKGGVGKSTLSLHIAMLLAAINRQKVLLVDADTQGSALDWSAQRTVDLPFRVIGLPKPVLHREIPAISRDYDWVIIDGPGRLNDAVVRSAIAASEIILIPVQPSPFDVWAASGIIDIITECLVHKPDLHSRFLINRQFANTTLSGEVKDALASFDLPTMETRITNRTEYAKSAKNGLTAIETDPHGPAAREINKLVNELRALLGISVMEKAHVVNG